ncbi:hypothetical protein X749_14375 [Mesorhizobium sp. LNJC391B00]|nr:hypothetical protein X749_14375 [Mesorhizobium sp. LNJC391B00]
MQIGLAPASDNFSAAASTSVVTDGAMASPSDL